MVLKGMGRIVSVAEREDKIDDPGKSSDQKRFQPHLWEGGISVILRC